jgi:hypothetical protein
MNTNVTSTCGNVAARVLHVGRAKIITSNRWSGGRRSARPQALVRARLVMVWRTHPASGCLECRWVTEPGTATDEDVSSCDLSRQAA